MIDVIWSVYTALAWVVISVWMIPTIIAHRRKNRNLLAIFVFSIIMSIVPMTAVSFFGFLALLALSLYRSPEKVLVKGEKGDRGGVGLSSYELYVLNSGPGCIVLSEQDWLESLRGKDADEIPLSRSGVLKPKSR